jgi:aerobic-type carbon monoxide dehydrogenase small subunit (CoxS/CutS family)
MRVNETIEVPRAEIAMDARLLDVLRERLGLTGTKEACGRGECGACTVLVDGRTVLSCIMLAWRIDGHVQTIEGLAEEAGDLRENFAATSAFQCGFCTPGQIVRGLALLREGLPATDDELRAAISGNICRCTGYQGIVEALRRTELDRSVRHAGTDHEAEPAT